MAVNTHKLLIMLVSINLLMGFVTQIYESPKTFNKDKINEQINIQEEYASKTIDESLFGWISNKYNQFENTVGSTLGMGWRILMIFVQGINPFPFGIGTGASNIEQIFIYILLLFKGFTYYIVGLEIYLVYKNKKSA